MCGISGFWNLKLYRNDTKEILDKMLKEIEHRGPDGMGMHLDKDNSIAMGHARLAIIDLHTGDQPIISADKKKILTANGEIYDYKRLRSDLMSRGERFTTKSDSEVILKLYEKYGLSFTEHLRGEFAFALFDSSKNRLILVRDRFGIRPLFFYKNENGFYYGSEIKSLLKHPEINPQMDSSSVLHQLMQTKVPGTTLFKNIHAVKPGTMLIIDKNKDSFNIEEKVYWDAEFPKLKDRPKEYSESEWVEKIRAELIRAVTLRLEADVPVGCYLSGGIDSCSILGLATGAQQSPVKAYTISFDHDDYDEAKIAVEMAESMNANHDILKLKAGDLYGKYF
ncbi:MAG: asparagine synthase (glutamine-hydrolyzing), partial [Leptospiraceae bacterium]|nr:asparagine synthase (glutamine-hydrolyzing) [Leptospiraceae bacterium]